MSLVTVTPENYIRAETDRTFRNVAGLAGGVNRFYHIRNPTPLDKQTVIRMNLDTLYSGVVVDTSKGATITLPGGPERAVHLRPDHRQRPLLPGGVLRSRGRTRSRATRSTCSWRCASRSSIRRIGRRWRS